MDDSWILISAALVFVMQAGFLCLESGLVRSKNSINVAAKNITDFIISVAIFWCFGFALMFGESQSGWFGFSEFFFGEQKTPFQVSFFVFEVMFCGTAATLLSGAVAERMSFNAYIVTTIILCAFIYPVCGHWAWSSLYSPENFGWLEKLGFVDFAGSTIVHSLGGSVALAAILIIGPRMGRFGKEGQPINGSNLPMSVLGTLLLWIGWFGFNGGSTLFLTDQVPIILLNTCVAAAWGGITASVCHYYFHRYIDIVYILNGVIAGLVAITAGCHVVSPKSAMFIGMIAGVVVYAGCILLEKLEIDDAIGVIPAHLFAGIWGTSAVAIFGDLSLIDNGLSRGEQLSVQLLGIVCVCTYSFVVSYLLLKLINVFVPLRVSRGDEIIGMNISEHKASTELIDLLGAMREQQFDEEAEPVFEEPFTEVGQIAKQYNKVIARVKKEIFKRDNAISQFVTSEKRKGAILDASMDSIISIDLNGNILEFNPAAERTFGYLKHHVVGRNFIDLFVLEKNRKDIKESLKHKFSGSRGLLRHRRNSLLLCRQSNDEFPAEISITGADFHNQTQNEFTLHIRDITRETKLKDKLKQLAYNDSLTGLYNRAYLTNTLYATIEKCKENKENVVLFFLDLDRFKQINDTLGHKAGDELLCEVARRLEKVTRLTDTISRWGGDEFIVFMSGYFEADFASRKANDILEIMRHPLILEGKELSIATSIGIAISEGGNINADELIQNADTAMYYAKQKGRDNFQLIDEAVNEPLLA